MNVWYVYVYVFLYCICLTTVAIWGNLLCHGGIFIFVFTYELFTSYILSYILFLYSYILYLIYKKNGFIIINLKKFFECLKFTHIFK